MDGMIFLAAGTLLAVLILGVVFVLCAVRLTRNQARGRAAVIVFAFFVPTLYVAYLFAAGHFRDEYHRGDSDAYYTDGYDNLSLGSGYVLWFFDETPWMSSIGRRSENAQVTNIQRLSINGSRVIGQVGKTNMEDGPVEYFFILDLQTEVLSKYETFAALTSATTAFSPLERPETLFNAKFNKERSGLFWPLVCLTPVALATILFALKLRRKRSMGKALIA